MLRPLSSLLLIALFAGTSLHASDAKRAMHYWNLGQQALHRGDDQRAKECFEESLAWDPELTRNYLSLAAVALGENREERACRYLALYLAAHPKHVAIRGHYADLLKQLNHLEEARVQFVHFTEDVQKDDYLADEHLIHCHTCLMQIAEKTGRRYEEHLHRGMGLLMLAHQRAKLEEESAKLSTESLLCRAAAELSLAKKEKPEEARPYWYLHETWKRLAQRHSAKCNLHQAAELAPFSYLTATERRDLHLHTQRMPGLK